MTNTLHLLQNLLDKGIRLSVDDAGQIVIRGDAKAMDPELIAAIKAEKSSIVGILRESQAGVKQSIPSVGRDSDSYFTSLQQQSLWLADRLGEGSAQYNMTYLLRLEGGLDKSVLMRALRQILDRHEGLRICFREDRDGGVKQIIQRADNFTLSVNDLTSLAEHNLIEDIRELARIESRIPFDLRCDLMLRAKLLVCSDEQQFLLVTMHHIASDGWSLGILTVELTRLYSAFSLGLADPLPPLKIQYVDYAHWQHKQLNEQGFERQLDYWRNQLADLPLVHSLPLDFKRPSVRAFNGGRVHSKIGQTVTSQLIARCRENDATLFMGIHATFAALLSRYSNENDIVVGCPVANREQAEITQLIGFFANVLVIRADLSASPDFTTLLRNSKQTLLAAYAHQQIPFEQLIEQLRPAREPGYSPLFQIMLDFQTDDASSMESSNLKMTLVDFDEKVAKYDLMLQVRESGKCLDLNWVYDNALFHESTITRLADSFSRLLTAFLESPQTGVLQVPLLTDQERTQQLCWNGAIAKRSKDQCIHQLFETQALDNGDKVALAYETEALTFSQLNAKANQLANFLIEKRVGPDIPVGIYLHRSLDTMVCILGVLKAGGAYVPLDPGNPEARLSYILKDVGPAVVLTEHGLYQNLPEGNFDVFCIDDVEFRRRLAGAPDANPQLDKLSSSNLAYVIYTSGTTGNPKGVQVEHKSVVNLCYSCIGNIALGTNARNWGLNASYSFDASVQGLAAMVYGLQLTLIPEEIRGEPVQFFDYLRRLHVDIFDCTPTQANALLDFAGPELGAYLLHWVVGGESISQELWGKIIKIVCGRNGKAFNVYGPTEACVNSTWAEIYPGSTPSIGRPIDNVQVYVLNSAGEMCPIGVTGELYIGGEGVARGYLNQPELTTQRFVLGSTGISSASDHRLYRTGDLVRWRADGNIEYFGRLDSQVKIRGFRIETAEIEQVCLEDKWVRQAVVTTKNDAQGEKILVAYILFNEHLDSAEIVNHVLSSNQEAGPLSVANNAHFHEAIQRLRLYLANKLPGYMVPKSIIPVLEFPLTRTGKLDLNALHQQHFPGSGENFLPPVTDMEIRLANIWADLLGVSSVSLDDNFFQLGGHSLTAMRLVAVIRKDLKREVSVRQILEASSLSAMADRVSRSGISPGHMRIAKAPRAGGIMASFEQQRLWLLDQIESGTSHYNIPCALLLKGELDVPALKLALNRLLERHESIRTCFEDDGSGNALQVVSVAGNLTIPIFDWSMLEEQTRCLQIKCAVEKEAQKKFDLRHDLMLRASLIICSADEHVLLITMHHIASDAWSLPILIKEFSIFYSACRAGVTEDLMPLDIQYADYSQWQREYLAGENLERQLAYWENQLAGLPAVHRLPLDFDRPVLQTFSGASHKVTLDAGLVQRFKALCVARGATLFMGLHAVFSIFLSRYSNEDDIIIGCPVANREQPEVADLIGFFVNTLVLRSNLSGAPTFLDVLERSKETLLAAYAHQQIPFQQIVERLQPERSLSYSPLFQIMLDMKSVDVGQLELPNLKLQIFEQQSVVAKYDLTLQIEETNQELKLDWQFNIDLFGVDLIERMSDNFNQLFHSLLASPEMHVFEVEMINEKERLRLGSWDSSAEPYPGDRCFYELFEAQAAHNPDAIAAIFPRAGEKNLVLSYGELNRQADQLVNYLGSGLSRKIIGICMERSADMFVCVLAVVKAGAAFLPLDPSHPKTRLSFMLENAGCKLVLTQQSLEDLFLNVSVEVFSVDREESRQALKNAVEITPDRPDSSDLAYVIYTSGSTGLPKGVMVEHHCLLTKFYAWDEAYQLKTGDAHLQMASFGFDVFVGDMVRSLCSGGHLIVAPKEYLLQPSALLDLITQHNVYLAEFVPAVLRLLVEHAKERNLFLPALKYLVVGSDVWTGKDHENTQAVLTSGTSLVNSYGVTEAGIDSAYYLSKPDNKFLGASPPIGKALKYVNLHVMDRYGKLVPIGVVGELYIGGAGLARGYIHDDVRTAERFVQKEINGQSVRLYRTGDIARRLPAGDIEYFGRADHQVKIRGFRIELSEIENALASCPEVKNAVVLAKPCALEDKRLVAYIVPDERPELPSENIDINSEELLTERLSFQLEAKLPQYMIPAVFVILDSFPLNANGKIDRNALPDPGKKQSVRRYQAPETPLQWQLATLWETVLGTETIGLNYNFFSLGGHSLSATRLIAAIRKNLGVELPLRDVFEHPTLAAMSVAVEKNQSLLVGQPIIKRSRHEKLKSSYAQQRLWMLDQIDGGSAHYNMLDAFELQGLLDKDAMAQAFARLLQRHEPLRTYFEDDGTGQAVQIIDAAEQFSVTTIDLSALSINERQTQLEMLINREAKTPFNLRRDCMLRATLVTFSIDKHVLVVTIHHIASDGWSAQILINELCTLYSALVRNEDNSFAPPVIQYADYAQWQREWLESSLLDKQMAYWERQLSGLPIVHSIPLDHERPLFQGFSGARHTCVIDAVLSTSLIEYCQSQGATLFMGLHAAFSAFLARYSGETDIVIGTPVANRGQPEVENLIGFFVNTLVLRGDISGEPTFAQMLTRSKELLVEAYAHQQVPFERIVEKLRPERSFNHSPLFQVMLVLQDDTPEIPALPELTLTPLELPVVVVKYDLTLQVERLDGQLQLCWDYSTDLFESHTIQQMSEVFIHLIGKWLQSPEENIFQFAMMPETYESFIQWNNYAAGYSNLKPIHEFFEGQVEKQADAIAVVCGTEHVTYGELNSRAERVAWYLVDDANVTADTLVGICLQRSVDMIVAILGILKAGGGYVPIDPDYPEARIDYILQDAKVGVVLTSESISARLSADVRKISLDSEAFILSSKRLGRLGPLGRRSTPSNLAYVIYTSGSTGEPKGVLVEHRNISALFEAADEIYQFNEQDIWTLFHSYAFDFSVWEMWGALRYGGRLVIVPNDVARSPEDFHQLLSSHRVTVLNQTPSAFQNLVYQVRESGPLEKLRYVIFGGEALNYALLEPWYNLHDERGPVLVNMYGITETTVHVTYQFIDKLMCTRDKKQSSIGAALTHLHVTVLDQYGHTVPPGVAGEIHVYGNGVTRGYLNRPAVTQQKFVVLPGRGNQLWYRTGDLARYSPSGVLEYLGRIDQQVKVRGFRIELGEIENYLLQIDCITDAVVLAKVNSAGEKYIAAYLVLDVSLSNAQVDSQTQSDELDKIRDALAERIPDYMLPSAFVVMDKLPLTPNGKVDRQSLPEPDFSLSGRTYIAPSNDRERILCEIWQDLLGVEKVGVTDNFFMLGGDSLSVLGLISRAKLAGIYLSAKSILSNRTIRKIAITAETDAQKPNDLLESRIPLLFSQLRHFYPVVNNPRLDVIIGQYPLSGFIDTERLKKSVTQVLNDHASLRFYFVKHGERWFAEVDEKIDSDFFLFIDLIEHKPDEQVARINSLVEAIIDKFDFTKGGLARFILVRQDAEQYLLILVAHHVLLDGYSLGLIEQDIIRNYVEISNEPSGQMLDNLEALSAMAEKHRAYVEDGALLAEASYWQSMPWDEVKLVPFDYVASNQQPRSSENLVEIILSRADTKTLVDVLSAYNLSCFHALAQAISEALAEFSGGSWTQLDCSVGGRSLSSGIDTSRAVGYLSHRGLFFLPYLGKGSAIERCIKISDQIARVPSHGVGYYLLSTAAARGVIVKQDERVRFNQQACLNYRGVTNHGGNGIADGGVTIGKQGGVNIKNPFADELPRFYFLEFNAILLDGELQIHCQYSRNQYSSNTIDKLTLSIRKKLMEFVVHSSPVKGFQHEHS